MKFSKIYSILFCLFCYSCKNIDTCKNEPLKNDSLTQINVRNINDIDRSEQNDKIENERKIDQELLTVWNTFTKIVATKNYYKLKNISLDTIEACHNVYNIDKFIQKCAPEIFDSLLLKRLSEISYSTYLGSDGATKQFQVLKELTPDGGWTVTFDFLKTRNGYKFYACDSYGGPICCR